MRIFSEFSLITTAIVVSVVLSSVALAEEDNTGTNPVNFTFDARFITEVAEFEDGGGSLLTNTFEFRWPLGRNVANLKGEGKGSLFYDMGNRLSMRVPLGRNVANLKGEGKGSLFYDMGNRLSMRVRARYQHLSVDTPGASPFDTSEVSGIGDFDARVLGLAYTGKKLIVAAGLEAFFDTASNDALGSGKTSLGPQVFAVFPGVLGGRSLFAPGYQYVFDVAGDDAEPDISRSQIDLYLVWMLAKGKNWLIVDPQAILDHETEKELGSIEAEWGFMIAPSVGASGYLRPGIGIGADKPYSWNTEVGLKFVWR
jgi:hypothetical protein